MLTHRTSAHMNVTIILFGGKHGARMKYAHLYVFLVLPVARQPLKESLSFGHRVVWCQCREVGVRGRGGGAGSL